MAKKLTTQRILYFITGHGYGHGVRSSTIINQLPADKEIYILTTLPQKFFFEELTRPFHYLSREIDCGCVQHNTVEIDILATLEKYAQLNQKRTVLITEIAGLLRQLKIDLVIGDIPPLAFPIARQAGLPSLAITNLTWADIYEPYVELYPYFSYLLEQIREDYAQTDQAFWLWPCLESQVFQRAESVGLLFREGHSCRELLAGRFGLNPDKKWCLVYIGNYGLEGIAWKRLEQFTDYEFFGLYPLQNAPKNYHLIIKDTSYHYADLTASADVVLGKLGYGLLSECLGLGKPVLFVSRENFREYDALKQPLSEREQGVEISPQQLQMLDIYSALEQLVAKAYKPLAENALPHIVKRICEF